MDVVITPHPLMGEIPAIASKSMAHRLLICAALCPEPTDIVCPTTSKDIEATISCLAALGAKVAREGDVLHVTPIPTDAETGHLAATRGALLDCGESGSTERFMLPVVAALACEGSLTGHGRLAARPLSPLYEELIAGGCDLTEQGTFPLKVTGSLRNGRFELPGNVSSQYISGLLLAAPLLGGPSEVRVTEPIESRPYVALTISALAQFGVHVSERKESDENGSYTVYAVSPMTPLRSPGEVVVEGDWSNAGFWLAAGALGQGVAVSGLDLASRQGDRAMMAALAKLGAQVRRSGGTASVFSGSPNGCEMNVADFPDLVPPLAAVAALAPGTTRLTGCARLRLKESDRVETVVGGLAALGADIAAEGDDIVINGRESLAGGAVDAANDHRIAMMAAIAASRCEGAVTVLGAECVQKSYPAFFEDYEKLGGIVETR
jgi:3-phosphoshikimate 1-carboxyvinyltransferase